MFDPQPSLVPPSTATTPASVCDICSREDVSRDIAILGVSSCLDMASLDRDMRAGWGTKAHAEATRHASTMNSASDKQQGVARCAKVSAGGQRRAVCARACEEQACVWPAGGEAEISGEAHSTFSVEKGQEVVFIVVVLQVYG